MVLPLLVVLAGPAVQDDQPPIRIQLNREEFARGDRARVYVETQRDGYLVALHADPDGRVRVLFPLDPTDDDFVRGGRRLELRGRSDRDAFLVDDEDGSGVVLAAYSPDPFRYDAFVRNGHWDYRVLGAPPARYAPGDAGGTSLQDDPLAGLLDIVQRMAGDIRFEYDAATYLVGGGRGVASRYGYGYRYGYGAPYGFRLGLSFGYPYHYSHFYSPFYDPFCYDPFWGVRAGCYGYGFGFGYARPYFARPHGYGRTFLSGGFGSRSGESRFVIPRGRERVTGIEPRRRVGVSGPASVRNGGGSRSAQPRVRELRGRERPGVPRIAPRGHDGGRRGPAVSRGRPGGFGGRPSVSRGGRGWRGGSRPAARPATRAPGGGRRRG